MQLQFSLFDRFKAPVPGAAYRLVAPDGRVFEGRTDVNGCVHLDDADGGEYQLSFPELAAQEWEEA